MYISFCETNKKNVLQKVIKDLPYEVSDPFPQFFKNFFPVRDQTFMTSTRRRGGEVLKFVTCLQILLFLNNRSIVHFWRRGALGGWGIVCGRHNCMIPNIKTYFDKKVTFLALALVLQ